MPSKPLLERAREVRAARRAGWDGAVDLATVMDSVRSAVLAVAADESPPVLASRGIRLVEGQARFTAPKRLEVDGTPARARVIVLATGAGPLIPEVDGLPDVEVLTTRHHLRSAVAACPARGRRRWRRAALRSAVGAALALAATAGLAGARLLEGPALPPLPGGFVEARSGTRAPELPVAAPQLVR